MDFLWRAFNRNSQKLLGCLGGSLLATAAALLYRLALALALVLLAELALEELGEQKITTYDSGGYADHDADDNEGGILLLFLLVEAEHSEHPP